MTEFPVAKFMRKDSDNLIRFALLNQGIIDDNVLLPRKTEEISIGVSASLASVDDIELVQGELETGGQSLDLGLELTLLEGREFVEKRQNGDGVNGNHEHLKSSSKGPEPEEELVTSLLDNLEETGENRGSENKAEELRLE